MTWKPVLWLLGLVALTGLFIAVFETGGQQAARTLPLDTPLLQVNPATLSRLSIQQGTNSIECVKRQDQWFLVKPVQMRADSSRVNRLVETLRGLRKHEVIGPDLREKRNLTLASFGLEPPKAVLSLGSDTRVDELLLGDLSPLGDRIYTQVRGTPDVIAASCRFPEVLDVTCGELQDRSVFPAAIKGAVRLEVKHPGGFYQVALREGVWRIQQPFIAAADGVKVERLLHALAALRLADVGDAPAPPEPLAYKQGEDETAIHVSIWPEGGREPLTFSTGVAWPGKPLLISARVGDVDRLCAVERQALAFLAVKPEALRDRRICDADPARINFIAVRDGELKLVVSRNAEGQWLITEPFQFAGNRLAVNALLKTLCALQGDTAPDAVDTNQVAREAAVMTCSLVVAQEAADIATTNEAGSRSAAGAVWSYRFSSPATVANNPVFREETATLYRVPSNELARLWRGGHQALADPLPYMDRRMLDVNPGQVRRITAGRQNREETVTRDATGVWVVESPPGGQVADGVIPALLEMASRLEAEQVDRATVANPEAYGLGDASARVTFGLSGGGIQKTVLLGNDNGQEGIYAMVQGQDALFVLRKSVADVLLRSFVKSP